MSQGTLQRFAPLTAFAFVALVIASFVVLGETPSSDAPTDEVVNFFKDNQDEAGISAGLLSLASLFLVWFAASLRGALRRAGEDADRLATISFTGLVFVALGFLCFAGFNATLSDIADNSSTVPGEVVQAVSVLNEDFFPILGVGIVMSMFATGLAIVRHGPFPRWLGWVGIAIAILFIPVWFIGFPGTGLFLLVLSVLMFRDGASGRTDAAG